MRKKKNSETGQKGIKSNGMKKYKHRIQVDVNNDSRNRHENDFFLYFFFFLSFSLFSSFGLPVTVSLSIIKNCEKSHLKDERNGIIFFISFLPTFFFVFSLHFFLSFISTLHFSLFHQTFLSSLLSYHHLLLT